MRNIAISLCVLVATPAIAEPGNPISGGGVSVEADGIRRPNITSNVPEAELAGVSVSIEASPGGIRTQYNNANDARAACVAARGSFSNTGGRLRCANPRTQLRGRIRRPNVESQVR